MNKKVLNANLLYLLLGITAYVLCVNFSKDWVHYLWWFGLLERTSWAEIWQQISPFREPIYNVSVKILSSYIGFSSVIFIATVGLLWVKLRTLENIVCHKWIGLFFYVCMYWLLFEGTQLRVAYATTFIILSFYHLQKSNLLLALTFILLASQIHFSAIVFGIVFVFYFFRFSTSLTFIFFLLAPLLVFFHISIFSLLEHLISLINPRYLLYGSEKVNGQNSTGLFFYFIAFFWMLLLLIEWQLKTLREDIFKTSLQRLCMAGVILMCAFHDHVAFGARFGELLMLPAVILLSWLYLQWYKDNKHISLGLLMGCFSIYFMARFIYLFPNVFHHVSTSGRVLA